MTTTRKPSASKAGQGARKAPAKKTTTTTKPRAAATAKAPVLEPPPPGAAANLLAMLVVLALTAYALAMNSIFPNQPAPVALARPAVHAPAVTKSAASCEAYNIELMAHGIAPNVCGGGK